MSYIPKNYVDGVGPTVSAAWLNELDQLANNALQGAITVPGLQAILGIPALPVTIANGGTGATTAGTALAALGGTTLTATLAAVNQAYIGGQLYPQTGAEIAAGVVPTQYQYPPYTAFRYMAAATQTAIQAYNSASVATAVTSALQTLLTLCATNACQAILPAGQYAINGNLNANFVGGGISLEGCGFAQSNSQILVTGTGYVALTLQGVISRLELAVGGTGNAANGVQLGSDAHPIAESWIPFLRVYGLAGFGVQINDAFDCLFGNISVQNCGTSTQYAYSMNNGASGSNECTTERLQVELSTNKAIFIDLVVSCAFTKIHSERTTGDGTNPTHILGGDTCFYGAVRCEASTNVIVNLTGSNCDYSTMRCSGATVNLATATAVQYQGSQLRHLTCTTLNAGAANVAGFDIYDSSIAALTYTLQTAGNLRITNSTIGTVAPSGSTSSCEFVDCNITGAWTNTGNTVADCRGCIIASFPTTQKLLLDNCTVAGSYALAFNQLVYAWKSTFNGALTLSAGGSVMFLYNGCKVNANLVGATGTNWGIFDASSGVSQGSTVGTDWYGVPAGLPAVLGQWAQGTQRWNPLPGAAGSIAQICTTGSTVGAGTWTGFTLP
jgi:hypothetical protein